MQAVRLLVVSVALLGSYAAVGQTNRRLDSLEVALRTQARPDTNRVKTLNELVWEHRTSNPTRSLALGAEARRLEQQLGFRRGAAKTEVLLGLVHAYAGRADSARAAFGRGLRLRRQLGDSVGAAGVINNLGTTHQEQGHYEVAVRLFVQALRMEEKYGTPERVAEDLANLGSVLAQMGRTQQALAYYRHYLAVKNRTYYAPNEAEIRRSLAELFWQTQQYDSARYYATVARQLSAGSGDRRGEGEALRLLGQAASATGQLGQAERDARQALQIAQQLGEKPAAARAWQVLGQVQQRQGQPAAALRSLGQALALSQQTASLPGQQQAAASLAQVAKQLGDFRQALRYQEQATRLQDSILAGQTTRQVADMQTRYETEKKEAQNRLQAAQLGTQQQVIRRRTAQLVAAGAGLLLVAGLGYLVYTRRRLRREVEFAQERQRLERLRSQAVLEAEENERRRIGSDLHDGVGQLLTAAKLNLSAFGDQLGPQPEGRQALLTNALEILDESFVEVRNISHNLMPNALLKSGLARAVRDFLHKATPDGYLKVTLEVVGLDEGSRLDPTLENVLFRVIQEVVQNVVKHARASALTLQLIRHPEELTVVVEDNGVGFDPAALGPAAGIGLHNIESRMAYLGGRADFDTTPGRGTTVTLEVPL